jgi:hypothetical protein
LKAAEQFMDDMEAKNEQALKSGVIVTSDIEEDMLREPTGTDLRELLSEGFQRGRILDQRRREGRTRDFWYLVYREPDGRVFALIATEVDGRFRIVIPDNPAAQRRRYLWDYTWTN